MSRRETIEVLSSCPLLQPLPRDALERLAGGAVRRDLAKGETLFRTGDACQWLFVIASGQVRAVQRGANGRELLLHVAEAGEAPGHIDLIDGGPRIADATAVGAVEVVAIPARGCGPPCWPIRRR